MIKNLVYATLGVGGVAAAATALVMATASNEPKKCTVTLNANGGMFLPGTNTVKTVEVAYSNNISQAFNAFAITNINYDLIGWTATKDGTDFITNATPVVSNMECFAKWQRSAIQKFNVTNGVFTGQVAQFPVVFHGTATAVDKTNQIIRFRSPTNGTFRISFDPPVGGTRVGAAVKITQVGGAFTNMTFNSTLNFDRATFDFVKDADYEIEIKVGLSSLYYVRYVFGIGLGDCQVRFDLNEGEYNYGSFYNPRFGTDGANLTTNYPFGYLPSVKESYPSHVTFQGWYSAKSGGLKLAASDLVGTNEVYYAHWKLPSFPYYVDFDRTDPFAEGLMDQQAFMSEVAQALSHNRFYLAEHKFVGWATTFEEASKGNKKYYDGEIVTNLCERPDGICTLYAVWRETPGTNSYTVSQYVTDFKNVAITTNVVTLVNGIGSYPTFTMTVTNVAENVRVSLDPATGCSRTGAKLIIDKMVGDETTTNAVCEVADLSTNEVRYTFAVGKYRFRVTGASSSYVYIVGLGTQGAQVDFESFGVAATGPSSTARSFNWTVGMPYAYEPELSSCSYGTFLWWDKSRNLGITNKFAATSIVEPSANKFYARWQNSPYYVEFENGEGASGTMSVQAFRYDIATTLNQNLFYRSEHRFAGWDTDPAGKTVVFGDAVLVTNLCSTVGQTNTLYAVWEKTPGKSEYFVAAGVTNFENVVVSSNDMVLAHVPGTVPVFLMALTNAATVRVSLDPEAGNRTNAKLAIYERPVGGTWTTNAVCEVSDLSTNAVGYAFVANAQYRFYLTGAASGASYLVGLGAEGARIDFDPCDGVVAAGSLTKSLTFDWTVGTPYGYLPQLAGDPFLGSFLGWFDTNIILATNASHRVSETNVVDAARTAYAHWQHPYYSVVFDKNDPIACGTMPEQLLNYGVPQALNRNQYYKDQSRFKGWATTVSGGAVYDDCAVVSNLCSIAGETNSLYAVWESTPGTNWYYVAGGMTNFGTIAVSQGSPALFVGKGDTTQFYIASASSNNCRVAIDPDLGFGRTGVKLTVSERQTATNKWESACEVTDLSEKEVKCSFKGGYQYRFDVSSGIGTNGYVVSIGAEGARYIFDVCGGNFVGEKETTKVKFYNWTVGSAIAYTPPATTNAYVHGTNTWHYTPQYLTLAQEREQGIKSFSVTNLIVSGGEKLYAHWSNAVIVGLVFDWNIAETNVVFTNYYGQGATVKLYDDAYVRQPTYDNRGFLGWTTNRTGIAGYDLTSFTATTNSAKFYYAQWTDEWKTSRTSDGAGLSIDGYYRTLGATLIIPTRVTMLGTTVEWPVNVVAIGELAFENCTFTTLELPSTLTRIGSAAFSGCSAFKVLNIPAGVTYLGDSAFDGCTSLTTVKFPTVEVENEYAESGFLDGVFDPESPSVELCTCLFKGCTSLKDVELPLGVNCIPDECFSGCTAMTSFDKMPYTVAKIGSEAFAGCTHLVTNVVTEAVEEIGDGAFLKCARLRQVRFLGDQPGDVAVDIFKGTQRNVLVGYLQNMCVTATEYCGGTWPELPGTWPSGSYSRTLTWLGGKYPRRKVIFSFNDNVVLWQCKQVPALYHSGRVFGLLAPTAEEMGDDFSGWYTQPIGGRKVGNYWVVPTASEGDSAPITVYAHWGEETEAGETEIGSRSSEEYPVSWPGAENAKWDFDEFTGFYSADDDMFYYSASTFNGIVFDADNNAITGTVKFVFQDGTYPADGGMQSSFTATITWNGGRTTSISGVADAEGYLRASGTRWSFGEGEEDGTLITKSGIYGWLTDNNEGTTFRVYAARNRTAQATEGAARTVVLTGLQATKGTWHVVLETESAEGDGENFAGGYSTLSITISGMGQATITGTLGDGTAVSTSSMLIIGDGCCCLPVSFRPYGGKGGFSFMLWFAWRSDGSFGEEDASIQGLTGWDASMSSHPFTATLAPKPLTFIDDQLYTGEKDFTAAAETLATITMKGKTWIVPTGEDNPYKLNLTYDYKTGIFTGSFVDPEDATRKAAVNGVFTDRITTEDGGTVVGEVYTGYGTAVIKGDGSYPVIIGDDVE